jgi:inner membrane protein
VWLLTGGRWTFLHYHRGITHSIIGTLALGIMLPTIVWLGDRVLARLRKRGPVVRFRGLLLASVTVAATHPLMDWTNNYGVRLLLPWSSKWFYGDLVFIIDPFIWLVVGSAAFLLTSNSRFTLIVWTILAAGLTTFIVFAASRQIDLAHPNVVRFVCLSIVLLAAIVRIMRWHVRPGRAIAWGAFIVVGLYWCALGWAHYKAHSQTINVATQLSSDNNEQFIRAATMPMLADPFRWQSVVETDRAFYKFPINLSGDLMAAGIRRFQKPMNGEEYLVTLASRDPRAQILLEFARFPLGRAKDPNCVTQTLVEFADLRYTEPGTRRGSFSLDVPIDCPQE